MAKLMKMYTEYNDRLKARGAKLIKFECPICSENIETLPAPKGDLWDTLAQCPHCEAPYMKITEGKSARGVIPEGAAA